MNSYDTDSDGLSEIDEIDFEILLQENDECDDDDDSCDGTISLPSPLFEKCFTSTGLSPKEKSHIFCKKLASPICSTDVKSGYANSNDIGKIHMENESCEQEMMETCHDFTCNDPLESFVLALGREKSYMRVDDDHHIESPLSVNPKLADGKFAFLSDKYNTQIKHINVNSITSQLQRNAHYKQHGPGVATALHYSKHNKYIGTSHGLILIFNEQFEISKVLTIPSSHSKSSSTSNSFTVTDMDASEGEAEMLLAGYSSGHMCLWDVERGIILKRMTDIHECRVCFIRILPTPPRTFILKNTTTHTPSPNSRDNTQKSSASVDEIYAVSVDTSGNVQRLPLALTRQCYRFRHAYMNLSL